MNRRIVTLRNPRGHALHCVLEEPAAGAAAARIALVLLCPGVKNRVGPHRLYRKLVPPFLARGIPVLRVDFHGLGDSEGEWPDDSLDTIYRLTETGHCTGDARAALDWIESHLGIRRCIVGGLCGAPITALHLASSDARVAALYSIGLPVRLDGTGAPRAVPRGELRSQRLGYLRKLARPGSWLRFLSLRSDYALAWRALTGRARQAVPARDLNPVLPRALLALLARGGEALLLFGERDPRRWDFEENLLQPCAAALARYASQIEYSLVPGANHVLGDPSATAAANRITGLWLDTHYQEMLGTDLARGAQTAAYAASSLGAS